jgi:hypothetical protein
VPSVGHAYAILRGRITGDAGKAKSFLESMTPEERTLRNRNESRLRRKAKKDYKPGRRP